MPQNTQKDAPCPHCGNTLGFAFGTCSYCGWNYLEDKFNFIRVTVADIPTSSMREHLVSKHARRTKHALVMRTK